MKTFYLVDFENLHEASLNITNKATANDEVLLFYTSNSPKIDLDYLEKHKCFFSYYGVKAGKQSLDMCLSSYLGYLIKSYGNKNKYVIVSADTDYDNVIAFWKNRNITKIARQSPKADNNKTASSTKTAVNKKEAKPSANEKTDLNNRITRILNSNGVKADVRGEITSLVIKNYGKGKNPVYLSIIQKYGQKDGRKYYNLIKKEL